VKVSVIVPVYNPGSNIDDCIRSLRRQSLPRRDYEVIFVDDGSTDGTPRRLRWLARRSRNIRFAEIPNSGWPGRPRNVGIDMARGEYVYLVDNDDWIGHEALERMVAMADADQADVLTGKVVGQGKSVARAIFRRNRSHVTLDWGPLVTLLSPHKLYRRSFLDAHRIRFPEGHYRLEDHNFVMRCYFAASSISILADYPCYHWVLRDLEVNASTRRFDVPDYYGRVAEILDIVEANTSPGEERDRLLSSWYTSKLLGRVGGLAYVERPDDYRIELYDEIRTLSMQRFGPRFDALLPFNLRIRAQLLRDDRFDDLLTLARREAALEPKVSSLALREHVRTPGALRITFRARLTGADAGGGPLAFAPEGEGDDATLRWVAPDGVVLTDNQRDATAALAAGATAQVFVRHPVDAVEYLLPAKTTTKLVEIPESGGQVRVQAAVRATLDPAVAAGGGPLPPGDWDLAVRLVIAGFHATGLVPGAKLRVTPDGRAIPRPKAPAAPPTLRGRVARRVRRVARARPGSGAAPTRGAGSRR
jgi:glycosyltransferase involved in cell wall biosynthesis